MAEFDSFPIINFGLGFNFSLISFWVRDGRIDQTPLAPRCITAKTSLTMLEEESHRRTNIVHVSSSSGSNKVESYHAYRLWEEAAGTTPLHFKSLTATQLNSTFHFIFLQLRRAHQQYHSSTHSYNGLIIPIDNRTFQRVQREETVITLILIQLRSFEPTPTGA